MRVSDYSFDISREPLIRPFEFKGGKFSEKWLIHTVMRSASGKTAAEIGGTAILWSDPGVFAAHSETGGNLLMAAMAEKALTICKDREYASPIDALLDVIGPLHEYGKQITANPELRKTFTLNSLVSFDLALWKLYSKEEGIQSFDDLLTEDLKPAFSERQRCLSCIPLITYNVPLGEVRDLAEQGHFFLKIKIGQSGSQQEMLEKDTRRLVEVFEATGELETPYSDCGKSVYYLDANGRYESAETLLSLLGAADRIGMLDRIKILEEPFPEELKLDVSDFPVRVAADESLHGIDDVNERIDLGYGAMALKPAGKTLSLSLLMGDAAFRRNVPCYVADSACVPALVEWNKNVAARLGNLPGLKVGAFESNGSQFYSHWRQLIENHPCSGAEWLEAHRGMFDLDDDYYKMSGGIFMEGAHTSSE